MPLPKPSKTASFKEYIEYYMSRKNWSQSQLSVCARLNQPYLNKIINERIRFPEIDILVCIVLALQLTEKECEDLLSRVERAFSPAIHSHTVFREIIRIYAKKELMTKVDVNMLNEADEYAKKRGGYLPDCNSTGK